MAGAPTPTTWAAAQVVGAVLVAAGLVPAGSAFVEFVKTGRTPMPPAPTERLVVSGFNRYVRNPMSVGLLLAILGQGVDLRQRAGAVLPRPRSGSRGAVVR